MSKKVPEEIDLNCDALPVDRENEGNDVIVGEPASGAGTSSTETRIEHKVDGVRVSGKDSESAGGIDELGKEGKMESVKHKGIDLEADIGSLGEEVDDKASPQFSSGGDSLMEVDGGSRGCGDGEGVSMEDNKPVETKQLAVRSSGGVAEDLNVSVCPNEDTLMERNSASIKSSSFADNGIQSGTAHDLGSDAVKPHSSETEGQDMEIDTPDDTIKKNLTIAIQDKGNRAFQNSKNGSNLLNDVVDSNPCISTDEDVSGDVDAIPEKLVEPEFCVSDIVWAKVRSHPWWPGQIFNRSAATAKAKKYYKKDCYLIAYFGDNTFAWNEASRIKPFRPHFSHMEKQNNMDEFHYAVDCALDEVSRRVEFGLACSCISEEAYAEIKTQLIVNAGIREESCRKDGGDRFSSAASFNPFELVERIKALAQSPCSDIDRLQFVTSQAQLLAFNRWKGYSQLPEFQDLCGLLDTDVEIALSEDVKKQSELIGNDVPSVEVEKQVLSERERSCRKDGGNSFSSAASLDPFELVERIKALAQSPAYSEVDKLQFLTSQAQLLAFHRWKGYSQLPEFQNLCGLLETDVEIALSKDVKKQSGFIGNDVPSVEVDKQVLSEREKSEGQDCTSQKQKKIPGDAKVSSKKEKSLSELIAERRLSVQNGKRKLNKKAADKLSSSSPAKKLKAVDSVHDDLALKQNKSNATTGSVDKSLESKQTFRVGASILKVASQLNGSSSTVSTPVLKHGDGTSQKKSAVNNKSEGKNLSGKAPRKTGFQANKPSTGEMLSQLCLAATDPFKGYGFLVSMIFFFTELRNAIAMNLNSSELFEQSSEQGTDGTIGEKSTRFEITGKSELASIKDTCCSDRIIQCLPEEQLGVYKHNQTTEASPEVPSKKGFSFIVSQLAVQATTNLDSEQKCTVTDENLKMEAEKRVADSDESCTEDLSPTALILNFSDLESVPSVEDLNKIFSRYGPLVAPGAEVLKKSIRARVVFKRHADAETAFSSSGKYSIFGPSLVSYRLKRLASTPTKSSPVVTKRSRADETCGDGNAT